jgi:hypothetical protein
VLDADRRLGFVRDAFLPGGHGSARHGIRAPCTAACASR